MLSRPPSLLTPLGGLGSPGSVSGLNNLAPLRRPRQLVRPMAALKRTGDISFALALLSLGAPLFLAIALLVKITSPGPIFFVQKRIGRRYRRFG